MYVWTSRVLRYWCFAFAGIEKHWFSCSHFQVLHYEFTAVLVLQKYYPANGGQELFPAMFKLDSKRRAGFTGLTADPVALTLSYADSRVPCCLAEGNKLATYTISGLAEVQKKHNDTEKVVAYFYLDTSGMVSLTHAEVKRVFNETEMVKKKVVDEEAGRSLAFVSCIYWLEKVSCEASTVRIHMAWVCYRMVKVETRQGIVCPLRLSD
jgi:hypothetical protein